MPSCDLTPLKAGVWRFVEDQNTPSTMKLVETASDQGRLEALLDAAKPPVPEGCTHLHYLLATPFRYPARQATRYRAQGERRGVFYAALRVETAATEVAFYRILFFLESPDTTPPRRPFEMTAFRATIATDRAVDVAAMAADEIARLSHPTDIAPCLALAEDVRTAGGQAIRYPSVRHPGGVNMAVLDCAAFASAEPGAMEGWYFRFATDRLFAVKRFGAGQLEFPFAGFAADPRIAARLDQRSGTE